MSSDNDQVKPHISIKTDPKNGSTHVEINMPAARSDSNESPGNSSNPPNQTAEGGSQGKEEENKGFTIAGYTPKQLLMAPIKPPDDDEK